MPEMHNGISAVITRAERGNHAAGTPQAVVKKVRTVLERATGGALRTGIGKRTSNVLREISKKGSSVADNVGKTLDRTVSQMTEGTVISVTGKGPRRYSKLGDDDDIEAGDPAMMNRARREEPTAEEDSERLQHDGWCMRGCRKCFRCVEKIAPRRLFGTLERTVEEANAFYRAIMYPLRNASKKNRMLMLLMWDLYAALFCTVLFLVMALMSIYTDEHLKAKRAHMSSGSVFDVGLNERVIARFFGIFNFDVACHQGHDLDMCGFWGMWQTQARSLACAIAPYLGAHLGAHPRIPRCVSGRISACIFQIIFNIVKMTFSLSTLPFFIFTISSIAKLLTHCDPTGYTWSGRVAALNATGLSAYLRWIKADVLGPERYRHEFSDHFPEKEIAKLHKAVAEGERVLEQVATAVVGVLCCTPSPRHVPSCAGVGATRDGDACHRQEEDGDQRTPRAHCHARDRVGGALPHVLPR